MSNKSVAYKPKKFKGFTNLFKNARAKDTKLPETEVVKKPFTGFTEAYKNFKPPEYDDYDDEDEEGVSFMAPVIPEEVKKVKVEYEHFVPTKYNEWRDERLEAIEEKMQAVGPKLEKEAAGTGGLEMGERPQARPSFYERPDSRSEPGTSDASLTFGGGAAGKFDDIFKTKLPSFRDLNDYPMKYQLQKINDRTKQYLRAIEDDCGANSKTDSHSSCYRSEMAPKVKPQEEADRRPLKEYFGRNVNYCRTKLIDFRREHFREWYSKFTFNYERKYKDMLDVTYTAYPEDFDTWHQRISEKVENKYRNVPENMTRQNIMATHKYFGDARGPEKITFNAGSDASLSGTFPSLSHCETCCEL